MNHVKDIIKKIDLSEWEPSDLRRRDAAIAYVIRDAVSHWRTVNNIEETCPRHNVKTVPSLLGLFVCPTCAREALHPQSMRTIKQPEARLPYKDEPEPLDCIMEISDTI